MTRERCCGKQNEVCDSKEAYTSSLNTCKTRYFANLITSKLRDLYRFVLFPAALYGLQILKTKMSRYKFLGWLHLNYKPNIGSA